MTRSNSVKTYRFSAQNHDGATDQEIEVRPTDEGVRIVSRSRTFGAGYPDEGALKEYAAVTIPRACLSLVLVALTELRAVIGLGESTP